MKLKKYLPDILFFAVIAAFLFWRAPYGYSFDDEPYLATLPQELMHGARLCIDEWHKCQNTGLLTYPVFRVLYGINGGVEGILLQMRYVYCVSWLLCLLFVSAKLNDLGNRKFLALAFMALFSPLDYMTLSYTSISLMATLAIAAIVYANVLKDETTAGTWLLLGFLFTVASLAYPYYAFVFVLFLAVYLLAKRKDKERRSLYIKNVLLSLLIPVVSAAAYLLWVLKSAGSLERLYTNIVMILKTFSNADMPLKNTVALMVYHQYTVPRGDTFFDAIIPLLVIGYLLRDKKKAKAPLMLAAAALWLYCQLPYLEDRHINAYFRMNAQVKDLIWIGLLAYILLEKKPRRLFLAFYPLSFLFAVVGFLCSNTMILVIAMGLSVGGMAAMIFIYLLARELYANVRKPWKAAAACAAAVVLLLQLGTEVIVRTRYQYRDENMDQLTCTITEGPSRGLITCEENLEEYTEEMDALNTLLPREKLQGKTFMALGCRPTVFLAADTVNAGYSSWTYNVENMNDVLQIYYELNNKPLPDYVLIKGDNGLPVYSENDYTATEYYGYTLLEKVT